MLEQGVCCVLNPRLEQILLYYKERIEVAITELLLNGVPMRETLASMELLFEGEVSCYNNANCNEETNNLFFKAIISGGV